MKKRPVLNTFILFFLFFELSSCAKVGYLWNQGLGQISLFSQGRKNRDILNDPKIPEEVKSKVRQIEKYKNYFYAYWKRESTRIYTETTILDREAVTYLVIASAFNEIKPKKECFPFMGCFPYLGFFSKKDAHIYANELESENWVTYVRPVYAYSTLGYFEDNILSSFFQYNDKEMAEMIFHELFHTIFFIKGEVDFNEALASYFSKEMVIDFFKMGAQERKKMAKSSAKMKKMNEKIVVLTKKLNDSYKEKKFKEKAEATQFFDNFMRSEFLPALVSTCTDLEIDNCYPAQRKWNNASLAAFLTYEKSGVSLEKLRGHLSLELKDFYRHIEREYKEYQKKKPKHTFSDQLFKPILN